MSQTQSPSSTIGISMTGVGAFAPKRIVTNEEISTLVETSDEWIVSRTGIKTRHMVSGDETVASLAIGAAKEALASAGMRGEEIDLIIVASSTSETVYPAVSCQVQLAIGAKKAAGFDMALACSGFVYSIVIASQFLKTGMYKNALVIGADVHTRVVDWSDRNTCILFGDGAGAAVLSAHPGEPDQFLAANLHLDGSKGPELTLYQTLKNCPLVEEKPEVNPYLYMNGKEMFKFAVGIVPSSIHESLEQAGLSINDIDYLVLHQANIRIMQAMTEKLGIPKEKLIANLDKYGNTSAASIPLALNEAVLDGRIQPGQVILLCGFGAGAAWGSTVLRWTCVDKRLSAPNSLQETLSV